MDKSDYIKDSIKRIFGTSVMILIFVIGILALHVSFLLVGQQENLKTSGEEFIIYLDEVQKNEETSKTGGSVYVEKTDNLKVQVVKPVSPTEGVKGQ